VAILKRDRFGRFVSPRRSVRRIQSRPLRDVLGRFVEVPPEVVGGKTTRGKPSKKSPSRKAEPKKGTGKKPALRVGAKKPAPPKVSPEKKRTGKKPAKKALVVEKVPVKKIPVKKAPAKKVPPKKVPAAKPKKAVPKKPAAVKPVSKKPKKAPAKKAPPKKVPAAKPKKVVPKKPAAVKPVSKKPKKPTAGRPPKKRKKKAELPPVPVRSREAETVIQAKLATLLGLIDMTEGGLDMAMQSFINGDGSVDGELRISGLPERWREPRGLPDLIATLSSAFQTFPVFDKAPSFGGGFWVTFAVRFGPQNETEAGELADLYKRFRGLFQIGTYPSAAWNSGPIQIAITDDRMGLRSMIHSLEVKRGIPPSAILIRFLWGPEWAHNSRMRPGHYKGEK